MTQASTTPLIVPGTVVGWIENGSPHFGRFVSEHRGKWIVETSPKKYQEIRPKDIAVIGPMGDPNRIASQAHEIAETWDMELLWVALLDEGFLEVTPADAACTYSSDPDPLLHCVAWIAMWNHPEYFARAGRTSFRIRSPEERKREEHRQKERKQEEDLINILEKATPRLKTEEIPLCVWLEEYEEFRQILEEEIFTGRSSGRFPRLRERLHNLIEGLYIASRVRWPLPYFLGTRLGFQDPWAETHPRIRTHIGRLQNWEPPPPLTRGCEIEPVGPLVSIDDASTRDRDDAFAFKILSENELILDIAIADLSEGVALYDDLLDQLADLGTSVYLPTRTFHLLPEEWGFARHSLDAGRERSIYLVRLHLDRDGRIKKFSGIFKGWCKISQQYSYEEADEILENDTEYRLLNRFVMAFREGRYLRGADEIDHPEATVIVVNNQPTALKIVQTGIGSRALVRELMILANMSFAIFARSRNLLIPYRIQEGSQGDRSPTLIRFSPLPHRGIAVEAYTYATSPIRRVQDLLVQRVVGTCFGGKSIEEHRLMELAERSEASHQEMRRWMKLAEFYWKLRYLEQFPETPLMGTVVQRSGNRAWVRVSPLEILLNLPPPPQPLSDAQPLKILSLDSERGILELSWG